MTVLQMSTFPRLLVVVLLLDGFLGALSLDIPSNVADGLKEHPHQVPYQNHPYDSSSGYRRRELQPTNDTTFQPLRIQFYTDADPAAISDEATSAKMTWLFETGLPRVAQVWSDALSVVPVFGNLMMSASEAVNDEQYCGNTDFMPEVPVEHITEGVPDTDLMVYVSATTNSPFCSSTFPRLAFGVACHFDQFDRPIGGAIHVCLNHIKDPSSPEDFEEQLTVDTLLQEMAHLLGFSSSRFRFFWDWDTGLPRTPRPFTPRTVTCVGDTDVEHFMDLPDENTLQFFTTDNNNGKPYAAIVTPRVRTVARNQFDCQSLPGAKLENQPSDEDSSCTGEHWEEHDYHPELMSGVLSNTYNILSPLTLALFEDSGWYRANYKQAEMSPWGLGAGCDFVSEPCLTIDEASNETAVPVYAKGYFCTNPIERGCSPTLSHKLACTVIDYDYLFPPTNQPDAPFQYFPDEPSKGGPWQADYCPLYGSTHSALEPAQLSCQDPNNENEVNIYSEVYGPDSQCISTGGGDSGCYQTACDQEDMTLKINIGGEWLTCEFDFQEFQVQGAASAFPFPVVCPRLSTACPQFFCPSSCEGRGICNYAHMENKCEARPKCEYPITTDPPTIGPTTTVTPTSAPNDPRPDIAPFSSPSEGTSPNEEPTRNIMPSPSPVTNRPSSPTPNTPEEPSSRSKEIYGTLILTASLVPALTLLLC